MSSALSEKLAALQALDRPALRARWEVAFERPPPKRTSRDLLRRALAYHLQEQVTGGLSRAARRRLAGLADRKIAATPPRPAAARLRTGTRLLREWRGEVHRVMVLDQDFEYRGARYASLSRIAREITGTRWSGPLFFGLRKPGGREGALPDGR